MSLNRLRRLSTRLLWWLSGRRTPPPESGVQQQVWPTNTRRTGLRFDERVRSLGRPRWLRLRGDNR